MEFSHATRSLRRSVIGLSALLIMLSASLTHGQTHGQVARSLEATASETSKYNLAELEDIRMTLFDITRMYQEIAEAYQMPRVIMATSQIQEQLAAMTVDDLYMFRDVGEDVTELHEAVGELAALSLSPLHRIPIIPRPLPRTGSGDPPAGQAARSPGLPDPSYSAVCGGTRPDTDAMFAAKVALQVARTVWTGFDRACGQVAVVLGEGGNTSLACIAADVVLYVAEAVVEDFAFCDGSIDSVHIDTNLARLEHIHDDIEFLQATLDAWILLSKKHRIESNMSRQPQKAPMAVFQLPEAFGGNLGLARVVVVDTINAMRDAEEPIDNAVVELAKGDDDLALGNYKEAYDHYTNAYLEATRVHLTQITGEPEPEPNGFAGEAASRAEPDQGGLPRRHGR